MTPRDFFAAGRLAEAVAVQERAVAEAPADPAARLLLVELLAFAGQLDAARTHLAIIDSDDPAWPRSARLFRGLLRAEERRSHAIGRPVFLTEPIPRHAKARWVAVKCLRDGRPDDAVRWMDRADECSPEIRGFVDGQEFDLLRDADDCFASILEAFVHGKYVWLPWEAVRRVKLAAPEFILDRLFRPAEVRFRDGSELAVHLPLLYPGSHRADGEFAAGRQTDFTGSEHGPIRCVGGKLLYAGDDELPLADCRMIELRG